MEIKSKAFKKADTANHLKDLILNGGEIKRKDIIEAEDISFNKFPPSNFQYDEYGFISNSKEK